MPLRGDVIFSVCSQQPWALGLRGWLKLKELGSWLVVLVLVLVQTEHTVGVAPDRTPTSSS